jgi:DNA-binding LacI/PurR family transcriptional regulator
MSPAITTMRQSKKQIGKLAVEILLGDQNEKSDKSRRGKMLKSELILRYSV